MGFMEGLMHVIGAGPSNQDTGIAQMGLGDRNITVLDQSPKHLIGKLANLPNAVSAQDVVESTERASHAEGTVGLLRRKSQADLRTMRAIAQAYAVQQQHRAGVMAVNTQLQVTDQRHLKKVLDHGLMTQVNAAEAGGYTRAYQQAQRGFNF